MESKSRKILVNVYSLVLSIFVCFIVGVALSKITDKVDMQALENLMLSGAFKQCRPERAETLQYMILTVLFPVLYMVFIPLIKKRSDNSLFFSQKMLNLINFAIFLTFAFLVLIILLYSDTSYSSISLNLFCGNLAIAMIISLVVSVVFILIGSRNKKNVGCLYFLLALAFIAYVFAKLISKITLHQTVTIWFIITMLGGILFITFLVQKQSASILTVFMDFILISPLLF